MNRRVKTIEGFNTDLARLTVTDYDDAGNVIKITDPMGHITSFAYDPMNRW